MSRTKQWLPLVLLFALLNCGFIAMEKWFQGKGIDTDVLMLGNLILFVATLLSFIVYIRSLKKAGPGAALRGMYGSFMIKFFTCLAAVAVYLAVFKKDVNKPALIICMGLYIIYTVIEVATLQKMLRRNKHA
jgi:hypothetical protein